MVSALHEHTANLRFVWRLISLQEVLVELRLKFLEKYIITTLDRRQKYDTEHTGSRVLGQSDVREPKNIVDLIIPFPELLRGDDE